MGDIDVWSQFGGLWGDLDTEEHYPKKRPVLAHYTAIGTVELILKSSELWMSHPLLMNDTEELRWGLHASIRVLENHAGLRENLGLRLHEGLLNCYLNAFNRFDSSHAFDTYIASFSEHDTSNDDGLLSMWRGYGGNGSGAAVIIDTSILNPPEEGSPVILAKVHYGSTDQREAWISDKLDEFCAALPIVDALSGQLEEVAEFLFNRFLFMALFSKHEGFKEEQEWRVAYLSYLDSQGILRPRLWYHNGPRGVEPKFRLPIEGIAELGGTFKPGDLVSKILLGPSASSTMAVASVKRMLECIGHQDLARKVVASGIPFRLAP